MANLKLLSPIILKWEGRKFTNDPLDKGKATKDGVTLSTWQKVGYDKNHDGHIDVEDLKLLTDDDFNMVLRSYWNVWQADLIKNQSIANILTDWVWGSGSWGVKIPQRILGIKSDGVVGNATLAMVNQSDQKELFDKIWNERKVFLENIVKNNPSQKRFIKGWLNRLADFKFS